MTALTANITSSQTLIPVDAGLVNGSFQYPLYFTVGSEALQVIGRAHEMTWLVDRGIAGTTAASHLSAATLTRYFPDSATGGPGGDVPEGTVVVTPPNEVDIGAALDVSMTSSALPPDASNGFATTADTLLANSLALSQDAGGSRIGNLTDPLEPQEAATKNYVDTLPAQPLAAVLAAGNDTGGVEFVHVPAVDVDAFAHLTATATGAGDAWTRALAQVVNGNAIAGPRAEASASGHTDACAYARSVDGDALADNDAAASGTGRSDAGGYASSVDGPAFSGGMATTTGSGNADASDLATANTGSAMAGSLAVRQAVSAGMSAIVDGTSARLAFNGTTPIAIPEIPATPTEQDIADVLVALGLATQAA